MSTTKTLLKDHLKGVKRVFVCTWETSIRDLLYAFILLTIIPYLF